VGKNRFNEEMADLDEQVGIGYVEEILGELKSGKEATVYCCRGGPRLAGKLVAAKIYRARTVRQFASAATYNAGRLRQPHKREARAMMRRTRFGQEQTFGKWVADEYETLRLLHAAGVCVPEPIALAQRIILMEYIGSEDEPAPLLNAVDFDRIEARRVFDVLARNIELMLAQDRVHADLSPYNVLYHEGEVRIIDVPQAVDARFNPNTLALLERDVERICQWAARYGIGSDPPRIARSLWARYLRSDL
jgi:RIO kinase 1